MKNQESEKMKEGLPNSKFKKDSVNSNNNCVNNSSPQNLQVIKKNEYLQCYFENNVCASISSYEIRSVPCLKKDFVYSGPNHPLPVPSEISGSNKAKYRMVNIKQDTLPNPAGSNSETMQRVLLTTMAAHQQNIFHLPSQRKLIIVHQKKPRACSAKLYGKKMPDMKGLYIKQYKLKEKLEPIAEEEEMTTDNEENAVVPAL